MIIGHGSVPFVVVIGAKHPYLNTGQTLTANTSENVKLVRADMQNGAIRKALA
jgi:hypothetical protein